MIRVTCNNTQSLNFATTCLTQLSFILKKTWINVWWKDPKQYQQNSIIRVGPKISFSLIEQAFFSLFNLI